MTELTCSIPSSEAHSTRSNSSCCSRLGRFPHPRADCPLRGRTWAPEGPRPPSIHSTWCWALVKESPPPRRGFFRPIADIWHGIWVVVSEWLGGGFLWRPSKWQSLDFLKLLSFSELGSFSWVFPALYLGLIRRKKPSVAQGGEGSPDCRYF